MPLIIALDASLSMQRQITGRESLTFHILATKGVNQLLEHLSTYSKMEYVALVTYSSSVEIKVDFTREYDQIRQVLKKLEPVDKSCVFTMLKAVAALLTTNWGAQSCAQVVVFTDCGVGLGNTSIKNLLNAIVGKEKEPEYAWISALKNIKVNFVCMGLHSDPYFSRIAIPLYQQLHDYFGLKGQLYVPKPIKDPSIANDAGENNTDMPSNAPISTVSSHSKSELGRTAMCELIERLCESSFKPFETILKCGGYFRLECPVILWPPPVPYRSSTISKPDMTIASKIEVCGYLSISDIGSPASYSRHLVLPKVERDKDKPVRRSSDKVSAQKSNSSNSSTSSNATKSNVLDPNSQNYEYEKLEQEIREFYTKDNSTKDNDDNSSDDVIEVTPPPPTSKITNESQKENMCVLLHGALKVENCAAVISLNDKTNTEWYGLLYSYSDSKKKSNLILNVLPPGTNIPWLGEFKMMGFAEDLLPGETGTFPVKAEKRSYSQSCVVWIRHASLQSDVQKVLRHAKKMPEKTQHFYKELNRIRRAALSIGFVELLEAMALLFENESAQLSLSSANPECLLQLKHAAIELRKPSNRDLKISIVPAQKFNPTAAAGAIGGSTSSAAGEQPPGSFNY